MNTKLLIDGIVRQTTVLIAQLSTAAGIRAPLAHVADRVFVDLAREIEAQGVGRKVVADMFGLALRTYQKKVQRLTESASARDQTLWQAVLEYLKAGSTNRASVLQRFSYDGEREVAAVLNDLVNSGLVYCTGRGDRALYGLTSETDRKTLLDRDDLDSVATMVWLTVHLQEPVAEQSVVAQFSGDESLVKRAVTSLLDDGRLKQDEAGLLVAENFVVPLGSEQGWEAAVFDHFRAVATAIAAKIKRGKPRSTEDDIVGGATLSFAVYPGHPQEAKVYALLRTVRAQVNELWSEVSDYNKQHPVPEEQSSTVTFYFGQSVDDGAEPQEEQAS